MKEPSDIGIHDRNYYVCDFKDHNVVVVSEEGKLLRKIGSEQVESFYLIVQVRSSIIQRGHALLMQDPSFNYNMNIQSLPGANDCSGEVV